MSKVSRILPLIFLVPIGALLLPSCNLGEPRAPERSFTPEDLLVGQEVMPSSWTREEPFLPAGDELVTPESVAIRFRAPDGDTRSEQAVYRYISAGVARRVFEKVYLPQVGHFHLVSDWTYESPAAEQSHFGCYDWEGRATPVCEWAGLYEEYIVVFRVHLTPGEVTLANVEQVVRAIDDRMVHYLKPQSVNGP